MPPMRLMSTQVPTPGGGSTGSGGSQTMAAGSWVTRVTSVPHS